MTARRTGWLLLALLPAGFLAYFFVYPLVSIMLTAFGVSSSDASVLETLLRPSLRGVVWFTLWQAAVSTALTLLVGIPGAYVLARYEFRGRRLVRALTVVPFVLPTVVVGSAFLALLGPRGVVGVDLSRSVAAILLAHVFFNYAVVVRTVGAFWEGLDSRVEDAARTLGATRFRTFRHVTLPLLTPAIASAASIVFLFTFTSFGIVLILGGPGHATVEVEIWRQAIGLVNLRTAAALALLQLIGVASILWLYSRSQRLGGRQLATPARTMRVRPRGRQRWLLAGNLVFMAALLGAPLALMTGRALGVGNRIGVEAFTDLGVRGANSPLFVPASTAITNSVRFAVAATVIAVIVGTAAATVVAYRRGALGRSFDIMLMLPLGTSAVTLGFGFLVAFDDPIDLRTWPWLIPIAHALIAIPFVVRTSVPVMRRVRHRLREAAATLGADPLRAWREIDLPLVSRAVAVAAGFAFAVSLGEFGATSFLARPDTPTLPIAIFRLLGQPGVLTFTRAMALSVILMVLTTAAILLIERARPEGGDGF